MYSAEQIKRQPGNVGLDIQEISKSSQPKVKWNGDMVSGL